MHGRHRPANRWEIRRNYLTAATCAPLGARRHDFLQRPLTCATAMPHLPGLRRAHSRPCTSSATSATRCGKQTSIPQTLAISPKAGMEIESALPNAIKIRGSKVVAQKLRKHPSTPSKINHSHPRIWRYNGRQTLERRAAPPLSLRMGIYLVIKYSADSIPIALPAYGDIPPYQLWYRMRKYRSSVYGRYNTSQAFREEAISTHTRV